MTTNETKDDMTRELLAALGAASIALVASLQKLGWSNEQINNDELIQHLHEVMKQSQA